MCGLAGVGDWSLVKASLLYLFYMLIVFFFFSFSATLGLPYHHFFLDKDRSSLCLAFRSVNSEIYDFFNISMYNIRNMSTGKYTQL